MLYSIILIALILIIGYEPKIDKLSNGDIIVWYNTNIFKDEKRNYFYLFKQDL